MKKGPDNRMRLIKKYFYIRTAEKLITLRK